jgi:hypothetical protein
MSLLYNRTDLILYIRTQLVPAYSADPTMAKRLTDTANFLESRRSTAASRKHVTNLADNGVRYCTDRGYWNLAFMIEVAMTLLENPTREPAAVPRFQELGIP